METLNILTEVPRAKPIPKKLFGQLSVCCENPEQVMFLDIETTGLSHYYDEITVIGWSLGGRSHTFIKGENPKIFLEDICSASAIVTFNGIRFDKRFVLQEHPSAIVPDIHIDLMYLCRRVGLKGGQKAIEKELGIDFRGGIDEVDGFAAVLLWHEYLNGSLDALRQLVKYNRADIAAMGSILDKTMKRLGFEPDLFGQHVAFVEWSAPQNMNVLPKIKLANQELQKAPTFRQLFEGTKAAKSKVVGIDLTGSEARPTGWCVLDGSKTVTATISTDADILERTVSENPDMVSIDSPLCLPFGRNTVFDDDPARDQYGIMRQCERELKRRGVNVYPSLLPSMQKLTARGIILANTLREMGIPVIESYPGAAQDIMRIPRKGAGEKWLKLGLQKFGVSGDYLSTKVTHDELDAITSALVGTFHLAGLSESLGSEQEPPLIIPDLKKKKLPFVIGVSGPIAAGKTTVSKILEEKGFAYTRFSLIIDEILDERGMLHNRENRQKIGIEINRTGRQRELAERTIKRVDGFDNIVVDGLRFPEDHAFLVETFGFSYTHIHVEAKESSRKSRYRSRLISENVESASTFESISTTAVERKVKSLKLLAHETFINEVEKNMIPSRIASLLRTS